MTHTPENWDIKFYIPGEALFAFEDALESLSSAVLSCLMEKGPHRDQWEIQAIFENKPDEEHLSAALSAAAIVAGVKMPRYTLRKMPSKNWLRESLKSFKPVVIGQYYIYGSHITRTPPKNKIPLEIDAATAFGSGEHQTTQGCMEALNELGHAVTSVLDMGCGSGILAMAYAKTFNKPADAVDNDPESVFVTGENVLKNGLGHYVKTWQSDGYKNVSGSYDLIFANILANPLMDMAGDLAAHLNPGGMAILSGFLYNQETDVLAAHTAVGLTFVKKYHIKGWSTLVVKKD